MDKSSDDDGNVVDTLLVNNEREISRTSEKGSIGINNASCQVVNATTPSSINLTVPTTTNATRQSLVSMRPPPSLIIPPLTNISSPTTPSTLSVRLTPSQVPPQLSVLPSPITPSVLNTTSQVPPPFSGVLSPTENMPTGGVARLPPGVTMTNGNMVNSSMIDQPVAGLQYNQVYNVESSYPIMPNWIDDREGEGLCTSLLFIAFAEDWKDYIGHGKRAKWLKRKIPMLYDRTTGLFKQYRTQRYQALHAKLGEEEAVAKKLYDSRQHSADSTGITDKSQPLFCILFF